MFNVNVLNNIQLPEPESKKMETGTAKGWLGEYHWVSLPSEADVVREVDDVLEWCKEHFGKSGSRWFEKNKKFYFKDEKDMSMFILRWS